MKQVNGKWAINIDETMDLRVAKGDKVAAEEVIAESKPVEKVELEMGELLKKIGNQKLEEKKDAEVTKGELWCEWGGIMGKNKLLWPVTGKFLGVTPEGRAEFEVKRNRHRQVTAPVAGTIDTDGDKWWLNFEAEEILAEELIEGKLWAKGLVKLNNWQGLNSSVEGKLGLVKSSDNLLLAKARALGLAGIIIFDSDTINSYLPTVKVSNETWKNLEALCEKDCRIWLNTGKGRMLIVKK